MPNGRIYFISRQPKVEARRSTCRTFFTMNRPIWKDMPRISDCLIMWGMIFEKAGINSKQRFPHYTPNKRTPDTYFVCIACT